MMKRIFCLSLFFGLAVSFVKAQTNSKKVLFVILDGIPADVIDSVATPNIDRVAKEGGFTKATMGGDVGTYSETPTISAVGYNSLLTGTWANKHNVWGNDIKQPNYNYWTLFRALRESNPEKKIAIYSTWLDNRTKLAGANLLETDHLAFDYYFDGFELDTLHFPHKKGKGYIHDIDELVSKEAARYISEEAPDMSWMYLEYSDDMGHQFGNSPQMIDGLQKADVQIGRVWEAIQYREKNFQEEWLLIITTDHGRELDGFGHGGQSERERTIWIATNSKDLNPQFSDRPEMVDIFPSIAYFMEMKLPKKVAMELDGVSFIGPVEANSFKAQINKGKLNLTWKAFSNESKGRIWVSTTNNFKDGGLDNYWLMGEVSLEDEKATFSIAQMESSIYKVVLETPTGYMNYWVLQ